MKIYTLYTITSLNSWVYFPGMILMIALMLPANTLSQSSPTPVSLGTSGNYNFRLKQIDFDDTLEYSGEIEVNITLPLEYSISQNYPNPFNPASTIRYTIPQTDFVKISIYNILGNEIKVLVNEEKDPGDYEISFDAREIASGVYFYKISTGKFSQIKKMIVMK